jgi:hypothetical protein
MPDSTSPRRLLASIEAKRATAERLLTLAKHETITELIRLAIRDLDEAVWWLNHKDVATRIAEMTIGFASVRLAMAKKAIDSYGSDAEIRTI